MLASTRIPAGLNLFRNTVQPRIYGHGQVVAEMMAWCEERGIHYVSDEIYGGFSAWEQR